MLAIILKHATRPKTVQALNVSTGKYKCSKSQTLASHSNHELSVATLCYFPLSPYFSHLSFHILATAKMRSTHTTMVLLQQLPRTGSYGVISCMHLPDLIRIVNLKLNQSSTNCSVSKKKFNIC